MDNQTKNLFHQDIYAYLNKNFKTTAILFEKECGLQLPLQKTNEEITSEYSDNLFNFWKEAGFEKRKTHDDEHKKKIEENEKKKKEEEEVKQKEEDDKKQKAKGNGKKKQNNHSYLKKTKLD